MKWGCFSKKVENREECFFCKKSGKLGVFGRKVENGGFVEKWTFTQRRVHYIQYQYFLFYILLI